MQLPLTWTTARPGDLYIEHARSQRCLSGCGRLHRGEYRSQAAALDPQKATVSCGQDILAGVLRRAAG
jgi:hypothetical protein